ncbi:hypothetical protein BDN67DRAFT_363510 [Paxillus ammoniavirescens]|nr:hypothetical protein BDN67DRAFT_363510 [Paxillus ammoniavirescens]
MREESGSSMVRAAVTMGKEIAAERVAVVTGNETVNAAFEMSLVEVPSFERRLFHSLFATQDLLRKVGVGRILHTLSLDGAIVPADISDQAWLGLPRNARPRTHSITEGD